jgi:serine protease Do
MKMKQILSVVLLSAGTSILSVWGYQKLAGSQPASAFSGDKSSIPANYANFFEKGIESGPVDFSPAADASVPAVVHIKTKIPAKQVQNNIPRGNGGGFFDDMFQEFFYGPGQRMIPEQRASGSGVIISEDGYIVTNNHVISDGRNGIADEITVTLNDKKTYKARLIGNDPSSDLAVLKVDGKNLPFLVYGNSDEVKIGQWVLAIGYPLSLETTVTAGIVSAKARRLGINERQSDAATAIESFIQTDAAVNQGNSGGALVNTKGELVGINSAIASPTGYYSGYSYAIPVNLVKKIINDLIKFGTVQRGYLGIEYPRPNYSDDQKKEAGVADLPGVYVSSVLKGGAADEAGLKVGDVITSLNGKKITSGAELVGVVASLNIGEKVKVGYVREGKNLTTTVTLKNASNTLTSVTAKSVVDKLGADFSGLSADAAAKIGIKGGVLVRRIREGGLISDQTRMKEGFIIYKVGNTVVNNMEEFRAALEKAGNSTTLEGVYNGLDAAYIYSVNDLKK